MTMTSSPPMRTSPIVMTVFSGLNVRLASLYGSVMRSTSCTPSSTSISRGSTLAAADRADHRARRAGRPVHVEAHLDQVRDDLLNLFLGRAFLHHDDHDQSLASRPFRSALHRSVPEPRRDRDLQPRASAS